MAIMLKRTSAVEPAFVKVLVYGASGAGKTTLIPSLPEPIVLSAEAGLLSIRGSNIPVYRDRHDGRSARGVCLAQ